MPEGSVQYLNNSPKLEISSGCLLFSNTSGTVPFMFVGQVSRPKPGNSYLLLAQLEHLCQKRWLELTFCHDRWLRLQVGAGAESMKGWGMDSRLMWDTSTGYDERKTKGKGRRQREERETEISFCIVGLLAVSSVDLLCSEPQALASSSSSSSSSSTAPCVSPSMEPIWSATQASANSH